MMGHIADRGVMLQQNMEDPIWLINGKNSVFLNFNLEL